MPGGRKHVDGKYAQRQGFIIIKQPVELTAVVAEPGTGVEGSAKNGLYAGYPAADRDRSA
jgi:hypothetical protein